MIVVVGIIMILAAVMISSFGGATESARSAQCLTNLRSLAQAANAAALTNHYPTAGSVEFYAAGFGNSGEVFWEEPGWISWLSDGHYGSDGSGKVTSHQSNDDIPFFGTGNDEDAKFALQHGSLWFCCNRNKALYTCPEHVRYRRDRNMTEPIFSYVMNGFFRWDTSRGSDSLPGGKNASIAIKYGNLTRADRILMFAELPTVDVDNGDKQVEDKKGMASDAILHYQDMNLKQDEENGGDAYAVEGSEAESIGFNHKVNKRTRCAHVVFADCHTEKIVWKEGGLDSKKLTGYLCRGIDVVLNPSHGWEIPQGADE